MHLATKSWQTMPPISGSCTAERISAVTLHTLRPVRWETLLLIKDFLPLWSLTFFLHLWTPGSSRYACSGMHASACIQLHWYAFRLQTSAWNSPWVITSTWITVGSRENSMGNWKTVVGEEQPRTKKSQALSRLLWLMSASFNSEIFQCLSGPSLRWHTGLFDFLNVKSADRGSSYTTCFGGWSWLNAVYMDVSVASVGRPWSLVTHGCILLSPA